VSDRSFRIGDTRITPATVTHAPKLHCVGYRINYQGHVAAYSGDSLYCESLVRLCHEADLAVLDCSFPENQPGAGHLHAGLCGRVAQEAGVNQLILSHFYPIAERFDVRAQARGYFSGKVRMARDLLKLRS
jgi:ribonuclease BN (tRNA processing enzyme)